VVEYGDRVVSVAFIFPGQGSQAPGMLHHLLDHPAVGRTLDEISDVLHSDVRSIDTEQDLEFTLDAQLALFAAGVATARALMEQNVRPAAVAGLSVGAFAAAVTAGLDECQVTKIVNATTTEQAPVFVGNINGPRQIVIAGSNVAMDRVLEQARRQGASKAVRLHVSALSHCPLLQPVADLLAKRISAMSLGPPQMVYVGNVNGRPLRTKELVANDLVNNIAHGVRWNDATTVLQELGCNLFLEMPPGHTLSDLAQHNLRGINSIPVEARVLPRILRVAQQEEANT
jgi:malonate decarboxylase epsilon subunit